MTTIVFDCEMLAENLEAYLERTIPLSEADAFEAHLERCDACRKSVHYSRAVRGLIDYVEASPAAPEVAPKAAAVVRGSIFERLSGAPWWFVSAALHVLVIALASLVSMAIAPPESNDSVIMVTTMQPRVALKDEQNDKPKATLQDIMAKHETQPTDVNSKESSDISVPPDIRALAALGDHFETVNPDLPDTHGAFGTEESRSFHSMEGNAEPAGGGGMGGLGSDDLIGVGGAASKGTGGGWGGGDGSGIGTGTGGGKGSFGNRNRGGRKLMVMKNGGSKETESAVDRGLDWLARNQEADGHWDMGKHGGNAARSDKGNLPATGWALLAFLGAGHTEKVGKYKENVRKGIEWLKSQQNYDTGAFSDYNYAQAIAGMAMAEAAGMGRVPETIESAQKALDVTAAVHAKYNTSERGGWTYTPMQLESIAGDMSNSGWAFMFVKSAKVAGLKVPHECIEGVKSYLDACENGKVPGDPYSGHKYSYVPHNADTGRGYIAILGRLFFGTPAMELESGVKFSIETYKLPGAGVRNLYYFYYMTLTTFQMGGDIWKDWNEALKKTIPPLQIRGGDNDGSWEPNTGWLSKEWGRVGETALSILCMEVYYRYQKLTPEKN